MRGSIPVRRAVWRTALCAALASPLLLAACAGRMPAGGGGWGRPDPVRFHSEHVRLFVEADSLEVTGIYRFFNRSRDPAERSLRYPFPLDSLMGAVGTVSVRARRPAGEWEPVTFTRSGAGDGLLWRLRFPAGDTLLVECVYRQALRGPRARYIVTTTAAWEEPLEAASFEVCLPPGAVPRGFSFPFRAALPGCFSYEARSFAPDRDVEVWWDP